MYKGKNTKNKSEIIIYFLLTLFIDGRLKSEEMRVKFNIRSLTMYRYISLIKDIIYDYEFYSIDIYYDKKNREYKYSANADYKG